MTNDVLARADRTDRAMIISGAGMAGLFAIYAIGDEVNLNSTKLDAAENYAVDRLEASDAFAAMLAERGTVAVQQNGVTEFYTHKGSNGTATGHITHMVNNCAKMAITYRDNGDERGRALVSDVMTFCP